MNVVALLIVIAVCLLVFLAVKPRSSQTESEQNARRKGLIAYFFSNSLLISWLVYKKNKPQDWL